jgi:exopolyphosphatase/guanosine-5'-triphosphate,3'-diphosphate pyrophosphatase
VEARARALFDGVQEAWELEDSDRDLLRWAARCHEIGMAISHKHYNRHSSYLLRNADLPGFSQFEQEALALLVWCHRRKLPKDQFDAMAAAERGKLLRLTVILRLACLFKYVEQLETLPNFRVTAKSRRIKLHFPADWVEQHPLTVYDLREERAHLRKLGIRLDLR